MVHYNMGNAYKEAGRLEEAERSYKKAIEIAPEFLWGHNNLAGIYFYTGRIKEAEAACLRVIEINPLLK